MTGSPITFWPSIGGKFGANAVNASVTIADGARSTWRRIDWANAKWV